MHPRNVISIVKDWSHISQSSPNAVAKALSVVSATAVALALLLALQHTVVLPADAQTLTTLYSFNPYKGHYDGVAPNGGLVLDASGNIYGTTHQDGSGNYYRGTVFKVTPSGKETLLFSFYAARGMGPYAGVVRDASGNFYGTTWEGGAHKNGTVFEVTASGTETVLHSFADYPGSKKRPADGYGPYGGVIFDAQGNLYGTTFAGGNYNCQGRSSCGAVFELTPSGTETLLYKFNGGSDGAGPYAPVIFDQNGNLYGTTEFGGAFDCGTVFQLTPSGIETVLYTFTCGSDGAYPYLAGLILDAEGNLYGATFNGGITNCQLGCGVVFKLTPSGAETVLYSFAGGADGANPLGGLVMDAQGNLYGAAAAQGANSSCWNGCGVVFELTPSGAETVLYSFTGGADGAYPNGPLVFDSQGNLYGTTVAGGIEGCNIVGCGTVFKLTP